MLQQQGKSWHIAFRQHSNTPTRQLADMRLNKIVEDKASSKNTDRFELKKLMNYIREGDTIHGHSIDLLATPSQTSAGW